MKLLIISTIGLIIAAFALFSLSWFVTVSSLFYVLAGCLLIMNSYFAYFAGCGVAEIVSEWKRKVRDRHYTRFFWYRKMGMFESAIFVEVKMADEYWLLDKIPGSSI